MSDESNNRLHAIVVGKVQGVSFRYFVLEQAKQLGLNGWVRNLWNGRVEIIAEGTQPDLDTLLNALRDGPPMARVVDVIVEWQTFTGEFADFRVKATSS